MNRREFLLACGAVVGTRNVFGWKESSVASIIKERLKQSDPDFFSPLPPELAEKAKLVPDFHKFMMASRRKGLLALEDAELPDDVKRLLLALKLEDVLHEHGSTLTHFLGVREILRSWGQPDWISSTGLFHAVYSTENNPVRALDPKSARDRARLRVVIGTDGEASTYLFGAVATEDVLEQVRSTGKRATTWWDRHLQKRLPLSKEKFQALAETLVANGFDPYVATKDPKTLEWLSRFEPFRPFLSKGAVHALDLAKDKEVPGT